MSASAQQGFVLSGESTSLRGLVSETWRSRRLLLMLARKDFFVRYRRASLGMIWAVGLPLSQAIVFALVLGRFKRFQTEVHYPTFVFAGVLAWHYFAGVVGASVTSIVDGSGIATRIYFPRAILPLNIVVANLYGFLPGIPILLLMMAIFGVPFGLHVLLLVPAVAVVVILASSFALVFAALEVYFRDMKWIVQAATQPWFWASGIFYPLSAVGGLRRWIEMNPGTGMIQLFRAATVGTEPGWTQALWWTFGWAVFMLAAAALLHRRYDRVFVDLL